MPKYVFELPDEIADFIRSEMNVEPTTYLQNVVIDPIIEKYENSVRKVETEKTEDTIKVKVAEAKKKMKVKDNTKEEAKIK